MAATFPSGGAATARPAEADPLAKLGGKYTVVRAGLDNPRQISLLGRGQILVAEAGHGKTGCTEQFCMGFSGKVTLLSGKTGRAVPVMTGLLSAAGGDGSFATGADGAGKRPGGEFFAAMTYAAPDQRPPGVSTRQLGKLMSRGPARRLRVAANISRFEIINDPDGEGVDSNPYSLLALKDGSRPASPVGS